MRSCGLIICLALSGWLISSNAKADEVNERVFAATGVVEQVNPADGTIVIQNEAISNYMSAMTMPFKVKDTKELTRAQAGDEISFQLHVTGTESWVDQFTQIGTVPLKENKPLNQPVSETQIVRARNPLLDYKFTNELEQLVSLSDFHGQALAITFFYTRCPLPDFCPRLSKNFQEASQKLESMPGAPANWHFLSFSFNPEFDTPPMLKAYGEGYQYDPKHWSFLTGPPDQIAELARESGVKYESDNGLINHNFRTLIIDANGHLQMVFPTSGDLSDEIVAEIVKAAAVTNQPVAR
ncbi:MAG: SCO family protein [Verrucomicrobiota bacterium]|jgi:protein SCO1/2